MKFHFESVDDAKPIRQQWMFELQSAAIVERKTI